MRLKRVAGWFLRLVQLFKDKLFLQLLQNWKNTNASPESLTVAELHTAELFIIRDVQGVVFENEIRSLKAGEELHPRSQLASLTPFIHNDIIRVGGRLRRADIPLDSKHPIILPKRHHLTPPGKATLIQR